MKRQHELSESGGHEKLRRQEPVSCQFCRRKKLRCDRGNPCSNCRARKLACANANSAAGTTAVPPTPQKAADASTSLVIEDLNTRVRNIESLLASAGALNPDFQSSMPMKIHGLPSRNQNPPDHEMNKTANWLEIDSFESEPPATGSIPDSITTEHFGNFISALTMPQVPTYFKQDILKALPTREQGEVLIEYYFEHINWLYHVVHVPTVRRIFHTLYSKIEQDRKPDLGHLALISTIFALSAYFCSPAANLYFKHSESKIMRRRWTLLAQDALSASNCLAKPTIETLQAMILMSNHLFPNSGALSSIRVVSSTIVFAAHGLLLHLTDNECNKRKRFNTEVDWIDIEVKRRIWWHVASTDWILSFMSGAQCGIYSLPAKHMIVDYPSNIDDTKITADGNYAQPDYIRTEMSYTRFRIRIAVVIREMIDATWELGCNVDDLPYEAVLEFDKKFSNLMTGFEDDVSSQQTLGIDKTTVSGITLLTRQRDMIYFGTHTRLTRLHRPYLTRGARDPKFAYSRMVCLRSARTVIEIGKRMMNYTEHLVSVRVWCVNHHIFVATVILVIDYCFNRDEPRAKERKEEILDSFKLLEDFASESTIATRGLGRLKKLLSERSHTKETKPAIVPSNANLAHSGVTLQKDNFVSHQPSQTQNQNDMGFQASNQNSDTVPVANPEEPFAGNGFDTSSLHQWHDFDFPDIDQVNFDVEMDVSQFEPLFQNADFSTNIF